jgi:hypothetical protein
MSRAAEEAHARWFEKHLEECARDLVVWARVYRAGYDKIEEGTVRSIERIRFETSAWSGVPREIVDPQGDKIRYWASFSDNHTGWESQTYQWKWFFKLEDAKKDLARKLTERAKDLRAEADRWDALAAAQAPAPATVVSP